MTTGQKLAAWPFTGSQASAGAKMNSRSKRCEPSAEASRALAIQRDGDRTESGDFNLNLRDLTITCPAGETERIEFGSVVEFDPRRATTATAARTAPPRAPAAVVPWRPPRTSASSEAAQATEDELRPRQAPRTGRRRAPARSPRPAPGPPRSLRRRAEAPLRLRSRLGHPELRNDPAKAA